MSCQALLTTFSNLAPLSSNLADIFFQTLHLFFKTLFGTGSPEVLEGSGRYRRIWEVVCSGGSGEVLLCWLWSIYPIYRISPAYPVLSYPILSFLSYIHLNMSYLVLYYPISSYLVLSHRFYSIYLDLSYPILSYPILSLRDTRRSAIQT